MPAILNEHGQAHAVKAILGEVKPTRTGTESFIRCCPALHRAHGGRGFGTLCHVCWEPLTFGSTWVWRSHLYHVWCGAQPPEPRRLTD